MIKLHKKSKVSSIFLLRFHSARKIQLQNVEEELYHKNNKMLEMQSYDRKLKKRNKDKKEAAKNSCGKLCRRERLQRECGTDHKSNLKIQNLKLNITTTKGKRRTNERMSEADHLTATTTNNRQASSTGRDPAPILIV